MLPKTRDVEDPQAKKSLFRAKNPLFRQTFHFFRKMLGPTMKTSLVLSDPRLVVRQDGQVSRDRGPFHPGRVNSKGYRVVELPTSRRTVGVHRLVAEAFLLPPLEGQTLVTHRDGNRLNNHYMNLEWISTQERLHRSLQTGRVLTPDIVRAIRRLQQLGYPPTEIARSLRLTPYHVTRVLSGQHWGHVT